MFERGICKLAFMCIFHSLKSMFCTYSGFTLDKTCRTALCRRFQLAFEVTRMLLVLTADTIHNKRNVSCSPKVAQIQPGRCGASQPSRGCDECSFVRRNSIPV
jgi:hypothetical protein